MAYSLMIVGLLISSYYPLLKPETKLRYFSYWQKRFFRLQPSKPSVHIDETRLKQKIQQGLPAWALRQIQKDLSTFKTIDSSRFNDYLRTHQSEHNRLIRVQIKKGFVNIQTEEPAVLKLKCYKLMHNLLQFLAKNHYIEDADFLLSLQDMVIFKPGTQAAPPILTFSKSLAIPIEKDLILIPDWMNLTDFIDMQSRIQYANHLFPWEHKKTILFWRGSNADSSGFRKKLVNLSHRYPTRINARFSQDDPSAYVSEEQHVAYKYQMTIDGARATWTRLVWQLTSNCLTFKHQSEHKQWFYDAIHPFKQYVPVIDEADLLKKLDWARDNPIAVQQIIHQANQFAKENLTLEDMVHYIIVLINEYSKRLSPSS